MGSLIMEPNDMNTYAGESQAMRNFTTICVALERFRSNGVFNGKNPLHFTFPLLLIQLSLASAIILLTYKVLKPLGQPSIIAQILGGIILGPSVLGRSSRFTFSFFPLRSFLVLDIISTFGYMFYFFLIGVQTDPWILKKIEKKTCFMGISTVGLPMVISTACSFLITHFIKIDKKIAHSLPIVALVESVLSFPIITQFLSELKIVNSEFGRVAMSSSVVSNLFSFCVITLAVLLKEGTTEKYFIVKTIATGLAVALVIAFVLRPVILWMIRQTPEGEPLKEECIYLVFVGVLVTGFCSQATGLHIYYGPFVLGMAIPAGPPLGSALVEKLELINSWLFMPLYFVKNGLVINTFGVKLRNYVAVQFIVIISCLGKFGGAFLPSVFYGKMPTKDAVALGLVMNAQGVLELGMFKMMKNAGAIDSEVFVVLCASMLVITGAITPIIRHLYDPSRRYKVYQRRTVMHTRPNSELRVLACIHDKENVHSTINLLEALNPSKRNPIETYVLHLIELIGRAQPLLIAHKLSSRSSSNASPSEQIVNAFRHHEQSNHGVISVYPFTAISSYATMHDNVCTIALDRRTSIIILPYHERFTSNAAFHSSKRGIKIMNNNILDKAPCSVAILIDRGLLHSSRPFLSSWSPYRVAVLFFGGADDREALALGKWMARHPHINLTMVRLLENGNITSDDRMERKLDNEVVSEFRLSMAGNYQFMYIEEVVMDVSGTVAVIRSMENNYELVMVGRSHNKGSPLTLGLADWDENTDLGAIGDVLASADFLGNTAVLVVQQHNNVVNERYEDSEQNLHMFQDLLEEEAESVPIQRRSM